MKAACEGLAPALHHVMNFETGSSEIVYSREYCPASRPGAVRMEIWKNKKGQAFSRFISGNARKKVFSYEISGWTPAPLYKGMLFDSDIPQAIAFACEEILRAG